MCNEAIKKAPWLVFDVQNCFVDLEMIITIHLLRLIPPDHPRVQEVCEKAVEKDLSQSKESLTTSRQGKYVIRRWIATHGS